MELNQCYGLWRIYTHYLIKKIHISPISTALLLVKLLYQDVVSWPGNWNYWWD